MRVVVTGGAGFIGRAVVGRLAVRGDEVITLVSDPGRAAHLSAKSVTLMASDLRSVAAMTEQMGGADAVIHGAGVYRIGIRARERPAMWDANVGATERVLDAAIAAGVPRVVHVSTNNVFGDTHGTKPDETFRRAAADRFLSVYDETKYRAHQAAEARIAAGAPILIVQPGQTYGPHDHSLASSQLQLAHAGKLRYIAFPSSGLAWVHVDDLSAAIVAAVERGRIGEAYSLAGDCRTIAESVAVAARIGGHRSPRLVIPTRLLRLIAPFNDRLGGLPGLPANLAETIRAGARVTYWAVHDKATAELGFSPRSLEAGVADTWGKA
jgi:dihydroflavonol-4-reductase